MTDDQARVEQRRGELLAAIEEDIQDNDKLARCYVYGINTMRFALWGSMAGNFLLGVFSSQIPTKVLAPTLPILSSVMAAAYYFLGKMSWREKSNTYYNARDRLKGLARRLKYEQHNPTPDSIAEVSKQYGVILGDRGGRLSAANNVEDQNIGKERPKPHG